MSADNHTSGTLTQADVAASLRRLGLKAGDVALVHSAMRTLGPLKKGPDTVIDALLEVLGPTGTLVVPTFSFQHAISSPDPLIDPANDPSEMGIITETARLRPDALRSVTYRHSFAAIGRRAKEVTQVDPALSPFDMRSSFGVMLALNTQVVLLGVTYDSSTTQHLAEYLSEVPYRRMVTVNIRLRLPDGTEIRQPVDDYQPMPNPDGSWYGSRNPDFNRLGRKLEEMGRVEMTAIGNAAVRRFSMREMIEMAVPEGIRDPNIFRTAEGDVDNYTRLDFGEIVLGPWIRDAQKRPIVRHQWAVVDPGKLAMPKEE
jgi:aminoglycoside 3-N-acetyltransferase